MLHSFIISCRHREIWEAKKSRYGSQGEGGKEQIMAVREREGKNR
jgi:hypothetical protein